jgi:uncharacterized membrane protein YozB (DUF420 family)
MSSSLITLIAYIGILTPLMLLGYFFARRKMFNPHHKLVMTSVVILNWIFIGAVMAKSYANGVAPNLPDDIGQISNLLPTIHLVTGAIAQVLATYLIVLMWTENTPIAWLAIIRTRNIKPIMRLTLALWLITILLGFGIYAVWNSPSSSTDDGLPPAATEEATQEVAPDVTEVIPEPDATEAISEPDATEAVPEPAATEESGD